MVCFAGAILPWGSALYGVAVCTPLPRREYRAEAHAGSERARPPDAPEGAETDSLPSMISRLGFLRSEDTEPPEEWRRAPSSCTRRPRCCGVEGIASARYRLQFRGQYRAHTLFSLLQFLRASQPPGSRWSAPEPRWRRRSAGPNGSPSPGQSRRPQSGRRTRRSWR